MSEYEELKKQRKGRRQPVKTDPYYNFERIPEEVIQENIRRFENDEPLTMSLRSLSRNVNFKKRISQKMLADSKKIKTKQDGRTNEGVHETSEGERKVEGEDQQDTIPSG